MSDVVVATKSTLKRWMERIAGASGMEVTKSHVSSMAMTLRQVGEGGAIGVILGAVDGTVGLDVKVGQSTVPVDLVSAGLSTAGALFWSGEDFNPELRNNASHSLAILTFRKTSQFIKMKRQPGLEDSDARASTTTDIGEEDPVVTAAKEL